MTSDLGEGDSPSPFLNRHEILRYSWAVDLESTGKAMGLTLPEIRLCQPNHSHS